MVDLIPVDHDPFAGNLVPVDHDPWATAGQSAFGGGPQSNVVGLAAPINAVVGAPSRAMATNPYPSGSEEWQFYENSRTRGIEQAGPEMALSLAGGGTPFAERGALGMAGGGIKAYHGSPYEGVRGLQEFRDSWTDRGIRNFIADRPQRGQYQLSDLVVPKEQRGQGIGSAFMNELTDIADANQRTVTLTPTTDYGATSMERLKGFYKQFGFVENKGRNKDFTISDSMYRRPDVGTSEQVPASTATEPTPSIRAFHGSPYDFEKFDLSKIGTGEGAQAYGHGLYFAENPATAQAYKDALASEHPIYDPSGAEMDWRYAEQPYGKAYHALANNGSFDAARADLARQADNAKSWGAGAIRTDMRPPEFYEAAGAALDELEKQGVSVGKQKGRMYEVNINADPEHFLDWDKPLSEQSEHVKNAIAAVDKSVSPATPNISQIKDPQIRTIVRSALKQNDGQADGLELMIDNDSGLYNAAVSHAKRNGVDLEKNDMRASDYVYQQAKPYIDALHASQNLMGDSLAKVLGIKGADMMQAGPAAARLREAGIPGIKYLDQGSPAGGEGTSNYVVFNEKLIDIIKKYGLAGLVAGGAAHFKTQPVDHDPFSQ